MSRVKIARIKVSPVITNCYLFFLEGNKEAIIIDPGDNSDKIIRTIEKIGCNPVAIFLTHGHYDHIGAVSALKEKYDISVYAHEYEKKLLEDSTLNLTSYSGNPYELKVDYLLEDEAQFELAGINIRVIHTPGHTRGCCCYHLYENGILFSGDTMFKGTWGRTDLPTGSENQIVRSIIDKLLPLSPKTKVYPGHMWTTTIGDERETYGYDFN
ncbi:MAG: MBL fold metallo-hydrolase [Eubacterium sp.]